jgi:hypothetical protein
MYSGGVSCVRSESAAAATASSSASSEERTSGLPSVLPLAETPATLEVRGELDKNRDAVLACSGGAALGVSALVQPDRSLDVRLVKKDPGDSAALQKEACVRQVLQPLRMATAAPGTSVLHAIR